MVSRDSEIIVPIPPAPTRPSTAEPRKLISKRNSAVAIIEGKACGMSEDLIVCRLVEPTAISASRGASSAFSNASAKSRPIIPMECNANASTPGNGPVPNATTKIAAKMISGTARLRVMAPRLNARSARLGVVFEAAKSASG